jgi:membrane protein YqaA with SNARE-associated domain
MQGLLDWVPQTPLLLCVAAVVVGVVGSLLPLSPIEPLLLGLAASAPAPLVLPIVALTTAATMAAKTLVYLASRGAEPALPARQRASLERVRVLLSRRRRVQLLTVLVSALAGLPPFYLVTVCCGVLRLPLRDYLVVGALGRGLRFAAIALLPQLLGAA